MRIRKKLYLCRAIRKRNSWSSERKSKVSLILPSRDKNADCRRQAEIAQLVEHDLAKVGVASSSLVFRSTLLGGFLGAASAKAKFTLILPSRDKKPDLRSKAEIAQLVEHDLAKVGVASSSLVFRSTRSRVKSGGT